MSKCPLTGLLALAILAWAQAPAQKSVTAAVQDRYNRIHSLQAEFQETLSYDGRTRRQERGTLYLLRPRKMRWDYKEPAGKMFVSDGKMFYLYSPNSNQFQKIKPKEIEDLRAPLAFLLGKLDFQKEFGQLSVKSTPEAIELKAGPRSPQEGYNQAVFTFDPKTYQIRRIVIDGQDGLTTEFLFSGETLNPPLEARLFQFQPPAGAEPVETVR